MSSTERPISQPEINGHPGAWVLGHNQQQGGSVLQAGGRALLIQSELTQALSTLRGRLGARAMMAAGMHRGIMNYTAFRPKAMMEVIRRVMMATVATPTVLDPAAGYSPQMIWMAQEMPYAQFIEVDSPDVAADKLIRLSRFNLPDNHNILGVDLNERDLDSVLKGNQVDVIIAIGAYVDPVAFVNYLDYLRRFLTKTGKIISALPYGPAIDEVKAHSAIFRRFGGELAGTVHSLDEIRTRLDRADFQHISTYRLSELARDLDHPIPADLEVLTVAQPNH